MREFIKLFKSKLYIYILKWSMQQTKESKVQVEHNFFKRERERERESVVKVIFLSMI